MFSINRGIAVVVLSALVAVVASAGRVPATAQVGVVRLTAILSQATAIGGDIPNGQAEFEQEPGKVKFKAKVGNVNLPNGTVASVKINGGTVGALTISGRKGEFKSTAITGLHAGDVVSVSAAGGLNVSGALN